MKNELLPVRELFFGLTNQFPVKRLREKILKNAIGAAYFNYQELMESSSTMGLGRAGENF